MTEGTYGYRAFIEDRYKELPARTSLPEVRGLGLLLTTCPISIAGGWQHLEQVGFRHYLEIEKLG